MTASAPPLLLYAIVLASGVAWNLGEGGRAAQSRALTRAHRVLAGLVAFLTAPALLVWMAGNVDETARSVGWVRALLAAVALLAVAQSVVAAATGRANWFVAVPVAAWNVVVLLVTLVGAVGWLVVPELPSALQAVVAAHASAFVPWLGTSVLLAPWLAPLPLLSGTHTERGPLRRLGRALVAVLAAAALARFAVAYPMARRAVERYATLDSSSVVERGGGDFAVGLSVLPMLDAPPPASLLRDDLALADSLGVWALLVRVADGGGSAAGLDSLQRALEPSRREARLLLAMTDGSARTVDRVVRRLHPDYLIIRDAASVEAMRAAAQVAHRLRPATRVALYASLTSVRDSALVGGAAGAGLDAVVLALEPGVRGARDDADALERMDRWMAEESGPRETWVLAEGAPLLFGEQSQRRLLRHVVAWASARSTVRGVIVAHASDYDRATGLRAAGGRWRPAVSDLTQLIRSLAEPATPTLP